MILTDKLSNIANAIRSKTGKSEEMTLDEMPVEIKGIFGNKVEKPFDCHSVTFVYGDKSYVRSVADGDTCADPVERGLIPTPTKESTAQYNYTFYGWGASDGVAADANILKNITEDKTVYATFTATVRMYTITWLDSDGVTELPGQKQWAYGTVPSYTPSKESAVFDGWTPSPVAVTGDATYTAKWIEIIGGSCGNALNWMFNAGTGVLTIYGSGYMKTYNTSTTPPWYNYRNEIKKIVIEDGVNSVSGYAFRYCTATEAVMADSVTFMGAYCFNYCSNLCSVELSANISQIQIGCFEKCTSLTDINLKNVTNIAGTAFSSCTALKSITIPDSLTSINTKAFSGSGITNAIFENTSGWYVTKTQGASSGTSVTVTDTSTAATYLKTTYKEYYWYRK